MRKYIIEFIGTFFLVLIIALTDNPIAIGAVLVALVYMGGYISGAHYNPAVTLAVLIRGSKMQWSTGLFYMVVQILGALLAAVVFFAVRGITFVPNPTTADIFIPVLIEIIFTFLLASVVLHTTTVKVTEGNHYYGLAIGATLMAIVFAGGPISGGVYNPAIALGTIVADSNNIGTHLSHLIIYLGGPFTGGALAGMVYTISSNEH